MTDDTKANFIKINLENPQTLHHTDSIDLGRPRIIALGGENTNTCTMAYSYARSIAKALWLNGITGGMDIYSTYYKFYGRDNTIDRIKLFARHRDKEKLAAYLDVAGAAILDNIYASQSYDLCERPKYVDDVFNFAFLPLVRGKNGHMFSNRRIAENMATTLVYTHCHGGYVLRMCEQMMTDRGTGTYYTKSQMYDLQKNLVCINFAPFAPLEEPRFSSLSFHSASDTSIHYYNDLDYHMKKTPNVFQPAFYDIKFGNIMVANNIKKDPLNEHSDVGLSGADDVLERLTHNGMVLFAAERNALLCATRAMLDRGPTPTIAEMLTTDLASYKQLKKQGDKIRHHLAIRSL